MMTIYKDTKADLTIKSCIDNRKNFTVVAGAGSGKTGSLVKALVYVKQRYGKKFLVANQKIVCITYTNAAVNVIKQRTNVDELFFITTIHKFLWELVKRYQSNIRTIIKEELIPDRIEGKKKTAAGSSKDAIKAQKQICELQIQSENLFQVAEFSYDDNRGRDYSTGCLDHDDIIDLSSLMISALPLLRTIIAQKFPFVFIDEAQDIFCKIMNVLNLVAEKNSGIVIGYFGDPMQQIYHDDRAGEFNGPKDAVNITKQENYRCSKEVVKLLNAVRSPLQQTATTEISGSVRMRLIKAEKGEGSRNVYSERQMSIALDSFNEALKYFKCTSLRDITCLFLTRQMIARRFGFSNLNKLFTGKYASKSAEDKFKQGSHFILQPLTTVIVPLIEAKNRGDNVGVMQIMRKYSPILDPTGCNKLKTIGEIRQKASDAINALINVWNSPLVTISDIFDVSRNYELLPVSDRLAEHLDRPLREEEYHEDAHSIEKEDWLVDELLRYGVNELLTYRDFIHNLTPYNTQHGVKGEEFKKVLVVLDDTEADWSNYSFSRLLIPQTTGKDPTQGQKQRSLNLLYVCFSRAVEDLYIILFTNNPIEAKKELVNIRGLFRDSQISIQGEEQNISDMGE